MRKAFLGAGFLVASLAAVVHLVSAQSPTVLLGAWEGTISNAYGSAPSHIEFSQKGDQVIWKWNFNVLSPPFSGEAEGSVSSFASPALELKGAYTAHTVSAMHGSPVTLRLNLGDDQLAGTGISARGNQPFNVAFTKKK